MTTCHPQCDLFYRNSRWVVTMLLEQVVDPSSGSRYCCQSHPSHSHLDWVSHLHPETDAKYMLGNWLVQHGTSGHLWWVADGSFKHFCCRTVCIWRCLCLLLCTHTGSRQTVCIFFVATHHCSQMSCQPSSWYCTSSNACFLPFPTNELVLSHPVKACIPGNALHTSSSSECPMALMSLCLCRCFVPVQNKILARIWLLKAQASTATSVSGDLITMHSCPSVSAWLAWSRIRVSASSCWVHSSCTLLHMMLSSPAASLRHFVLWVV